MLLLKLRDQGQVWRFSSIIPATPKEEIRKITVQSQPRQKVSEAPISTTKSGMMVKTCNPSYVVGTCKRITVQGWPGTRPYLKNN
jgi:hypothetical protein